jgi:predicted ATP-grasp superfamily ATP-dependent carboligase
VTPADIAPGEAWLVKPLASGGGHRVRGWTGRLPAGCYLQSFVAGVPCSVVFVAARGRAVPIGYSRQIVGDAAFGARGYRYCGSLLTCDGHGEVLEPLVRRASVLATVAAAEFDLAGVNGIDFIACGGEPVAIEINPRWSASMELVERASGVPVFGLHAEACASGRLPARAPRPRAVRVQGKAIVFARRTVTVGRTDAWLDRGVRDVPYPGDVVRAGHPVCTVFAEADTERACYGALVTGAALVYDDLDRWARRAA